MAVAPSISIHALSILDGVTGSQALAYGLTAIFSFLMMSLIELNNDELPAHYVLPNCVEASHLHGHE